MTASRSHAAPGAYPQRAEASGAGGPEALRRAVASRWPGRAEPRWPQRIELAFASASARLRFADAKAFDTELQELRLRLRSDAGRGDAAAGEALAHALALAAEAMTRTLGKTPYPTQLHAAWWLLEGRLVEMATGEGKTLAAGLAAAVAALGGAAVHVLTANDYLVQRDRDALAPFFAALRLRSACVVGTLAPAQRAAAWREAIVYTTAREVAFDYLRDHVALGGERDARLLRARELDAAERDAARAAGEPVLPGLHFAIVDEADSILLDEAVVPLILAAPVAALDADGYRRAFEIAAGLQRGRDYVLQPAQRSVYLNEDGRARVGDALRGAGGVLAPARRGIELVEAALAARWLYRRDRDYAVRDAKVQLIDELTGRIAAGRQWQGALHPMVEIKEGLAPSAPTATIAQITYQRFFPRYLRLAGTSGTLLEARHELHACYGAPVLRLPLAQPDRRRWLGEQVFADAAQQQRAVVAAVRAAQALGRPVLVGTDSVGASAQLSAALHAAGIEHQLLHATQDADEAARVARAGEAGVVTVATNIAGRGTDIRLDERAAAAGGLHVIATMRNRSRRIDRQLIGRAARHGDPGSAQALLALDDALLVRAWPAALRRAAAAFAGADGALPAGLARVLFGVAQSIHESRDRTSRRALRERDQRAAQLYGFAGGTE